MRINVGCGMAPTEGWQNYDNSPSVLLARHPWLHATLRMLGFVNKPQDDFIAFCRAHQIKYASAKKLPHANSSIDVIYASHMFEHFDATDSHAFLREARRVLKPGGILRLVVPDLGIHIDEYREHLDADRFLAALHITLEKPRGKRLVAFLLLGDRNHHNMFDKRSLPKLLVQSGFVDAVALPAGATTIPESGGLNLSERSDESLFVEARKAP